MKIVVDGIQGVGGLHCDVKEMGVDILCTAGPKWLLSPLGIGFMFVHKETLKELVPPSLGWLALRRDEEKPFEELTRYDWEPYQDARKLEVATLSFILSSAMATSINLLCAVGMRRVEEHIATLNEMLYPELAKIGWKPVLGHEFKEYCSNIAVFYPRDFTRLEKVVEENNIGVTLREGRLRIAPHLYNNIDDIEKFLITCVNHSA